MRCDEGNEKTVLERGAFVQNVHNAPTAEHLNIHNQFLFTAYFILVYLSIIGTRTIFLEAFEDGILMGGRVTFLACFAS